MSNFSFSHSVFYLFQELSSIFIKFEIFTCKLFLSVWGSLKSVVCKRVNFLKTFAIHFIALETFISVKLLVLHSVCSTIESQVLVTLRKDWLEPAISPFPTVFLHVQRKHIHLTQYVIDWWKFHLNKFCLISLPHNRYHLQPWERKLLKTLWEKKKILVIIFFSFAQRFPKQISFFSSPEHNVLRMSYCDRSLSGVRPFVRPWTIT